MPNVLKIAVSLGFLDQSTDSIPQTDTVNVGLSRKSTNNPSESFAFKGVVAITHGGRDLMSAGVLGQVSTIGRVLIKNLALKGPAPWVFGNVLRVGASGSALWGYVVVMFFADGSIARQDALNIQDGNDALDVTNYNTVSWSDWWPYGLLRVEVYRVFHSGSSPASGGKIASITTSGTTSYNDQGAVGDESDPPDAIDSEYPVAFGGDGVNYPIVVRAQRFAAVRWNGDQFWGKSVLGGLPCEVTIISQ